MCAVCKCGWMDCECRCAKPEKAPVGRPIDPITESALEVWKARRQVTGHLSESFVGLRSAVLRLALLMEARLRRNESRGGWDALSYEQLVGRLAKCVEDVNNAIHAETFNPELVAVKAADVANYAMMLADNARNAAPPESSDVVALRRELEEKTVLLQGREAEIRRLSEVIDREAKRHAGRHSSDFPCTCRLCRASELNKTRHMLSST